MNTNTIIDKLNTKRNGSWFLITWESDLPLVASAKKAGVTGYKRVTAQCRKGINYTHIKSVQKKHGLEYKAEQLPWGNWKEGREGLIIEHKNNDYLRLYYGPNKSKVEYYLNGRKVTREELYNSGMVQKSYFKAKEKSECISVKTNNIVKIY